MLLNFGQIEYRFSIVVFREVIRIVENIQLLPEASEFSKEFPENIISPTLGKANYGSRAEIFLHYLKVGWYP